MTAAPLVVSVQAIGGTNLDTPVGVSFPNLDGAAPGSGMLIYSFNHDAGRWEIVGSATVSPDGMSIDSDAGSGIRAPGWHFPDPWSQGRRDRPLPPQDSPDFPDPDNPPPPPPGGDGPAPPGSGGGGGGGGGGVGVTPVDVDPLPPCAFVAIAAAGLETLRVRTDASGLFHAYLPPNTQFEFHAFDPATEFIWNTSGVSNAAGQSTSLGTPMFAPSTAPDGDNDGLPDDIQFTIFQGPRYDFGTPTSPVLNGWTRVAGTTVYTPQSGFGWLSAVDSVDRGTPAAKLDRDFNAASSATFVADIPNGTYDVCVTLGDSARARDLMAVTVEGTLRTSITTAANQFICQTYRVVVADGQLTVAIADQGGSDGQFVLNALEVNLLLPRSPSAAAGLTELTGQFFFAIQDLDHDFTQFGQTTLAQSGYLCSTGATLAPGARHRQWVYHVDTGLTGYSDFTTPAAGQSFDMPAIVMGNVSSVDSDGDGLSDVAEFIIQTRHDLVDSDTDGLTDLAEIQQRLNPNDGRAFPTGIISTLPLRGPANEVVVEGSITDPDDLTAYIATGGAGGGLAIVNASHFGSPIVLGQLSLPGSAIDVAVDSRRGIAVVSSGLGGLHFVDVSDPMLPTLLRTIPVTSGQLEVVGGIAYVALEGVAELRSYDVLTGELTQRLTPGGSIITGLARDGSLLFSMDSGRTLRAIDLSGPFMIARGSVTLTHGAGRLFVGAGVAYAVANADRAVSPPPTSPTPTPSARSAPPTSCPPTSRPAPPSPPTAPAGAWPWALTA
jgi:hypothetical protein